MDGVARYQWYLRHLRYLFSLTMMDENAEEYHVAADEMGLGKVLVLSSRCTERLSEL
jgi:hypothetical protein